MFSTCGLASPEQQDLATVQFFYIEPTKILPINKYYQLGKLFLPSIPKDDLLD